MTRLFLSIYLFLYILKKNSNIYVLSIIFLTSLSACTKHYPAIHLYDGSHKEKQKLAALWDFNSDGFTLDGQNISSYLPQKLATKVQIFDEYLVLPGKRRFVFSKKTIIGYVKTINCRDELIYCLRDQCPLTTQDESFCNRSPFINCPSTSSSSSELPPTCDSKNDENCILHSIKMCSLENKPKYRAVDSKEILLNLKAKHKYFITVNEATLSEEPKIVEKESDLDYIVITQPTTVEVRDLGMNPEIKNPIVTGASKKSKDYIKVLKAGKVIYNND